MNDYWKYIHIKNIILSFWARGGLAGVFQIIVLLKNLSVLQLQASRTFSFRISQVESRFMAPWPAVPSSDHPSVYKHLSTRHCRTPTWPDLLSWPPHVYIRLYLSCLSAAGFPPLIQVPLKVSSSLFGLPLSSGVMVWVSHLETISILTETLYK